MTLMAKAKKYKLQARESAADTWFDCGNARFNSKEEGDKAAQIMKSMAGSDDLFQCVECDAEEAEQTSTAR